MSTEAREAIKISGASWSRTAELVDLGLWNRPLCDPETAASGSVYLPNGPWATGTYFFTFLYLSIHLLLTISLLMAAVPDYAQSAQLGFAGQLMRQNLMNIHRAYHVTLLKHGMDQETLNVWSENVEDGMSVIFIPASTFGHSLTEY